MSSNKSSILVWKGIGFPSNILTSSTIILAFPFIKYSITGIIFCISTSLKNNRYTANKIFLACFLLSPGFNPMWYLLKYYDSLSCSVSSYDSERTVYISLLKFSISNIFTSYRFYGFRIKDRSLMSIYSICISIAK